MSDSNKCDLNLSKCMEYNFVMNLFFKTEL